MSIVLSHTRTSLVNGAEVQALETIACLIKTQCHLQLLIHDGFAVLW